MKECVSADNPFEFVACVVFLSGGMVEECDGKLVADGWMKVTDTVKPHETHFFAWHKVFVAGCVGTQILGCFVQAFSSVKMYLLHSQFSQHNGLKSPFKHNDR